LEVGVGVMKDKLHEMSTWEKSTVDGDMYI
jgi:hypothetical protein